MGASDHLNHKQLKLFMTARELMQHPAGDDTEHWRPMEQNRELFNEKLGEALDFGDEGEEPLYDSIKEHGVQEPINLDFVSKEDNTPVISDGHHRIAAAYAVNPDMFIPIEYADDVRPFNLGIDVRKQSGRNS